MSLYVSLFSSDNRRLDEWITIDRFESLKKIIDTSRSDALRSSMEPVDGPDRKITRNQKRKHDEINHVQRVHTLEKIDIIALKYSYTVAPAHIDKKVILMRAC